eukprot:1804533-Pyramimonas_sp.AAC.1
MPLTAAAGLGTEFRQVPGECPACEKCVQDVDCNQQGVLMTLDEAEREYQEKKTRYEQDKRTKSKGNMDKAKEKYDMWVHCLTITLPAAGEAYQEGVGILPLNFQTLRNLDNCSTVREAEWCSGSHRRITNHYIHGH